MQYLGGKFYIAKALSELLNTLPGRVYIEPFCGGLYVAERVNAEQVLLNDACKALITTYRAVQAGWDPPTALDHGEWLALKAVQDPNDPLTAFAGFGVSYAGKWFTSYAKDNPGNRYAEQARNTLLRKLKALQRAVFTADHYADVQVPNGAVVYCDPPYAGTAGYDAVGPFDSDAFWAWAAELSDRAFVLVSEYAAPADWVPVWTGTKAVNAGPNGMTAVEALFTRQGGLYARYTSRS